MKKSFDYLKPITEEYLILSEQKDKLHNKSAGERTMEYLRFLSRYGGRDEVTEIKKTIKEANKIAEDFSPKLKGYFQIPPSTSIESYKDIYRTLMSDFKKGRLNQFNSENGQIEWLQKYGYNINLDHFWNILPHGNKKFKESISNWGKMSLPLEITVEIREKLLSSDLEKFFIPGGQIKWLTQNGFNVSLIQFWSIIPKEIKDLPECNWKKISLSYKNAVQRLKDYEDILNKISELDINKERLFRFIVLPRIENETISLIKIHIDDIENLFINFNINGFNNENIELIELEKYIPINTIKDLFKAFSVTHTEKKLKKEAWVKGFEKKYPSKINNLSLFISKQDSNSLEKIKNNHNEILDLFTDVENYKYQLLELKYRNLTKKIGKGLIIKLFFLLYDKNIEDEFLRVKKIGEKRRKKLNEKQLIYEKFVKLRGEKGEKYQAHPEKETARLLRFLNLNNIKPGEIDNIVKQVRKFKIKDSLGENIDFKLPKRISYETYVNVQRILNIEFQNGTLQTKYSEPEDILKWIDKHRIDISPPSLWAIIPKHIKKEIGWKRSDLSKKEMEKRIPQYSSLKKIYPLSDTSRIYSFVFSGKIDRKTLNNILKEDNIKKINIVFTNILESKFNEIKESYIEIINEFTQENINRLFYAIYAKDFNQNLERAKINSSLENIQDIYTSEFGQILWMNKNDVKFNPQLFWQIIRTDLKEKLLTKWKAIPFSKEEATTRLNLSLEFKKVYSYAFPNINSEDVLYSFIMHEKINVNDISKIIENSSQIVLLLQKINDGYFEDVKFIFYELIKKGITERLLSITNKLFHDSKLSSIIERAKNADKLRKLPISYNTPDGLIKWFNINFPGLSLQHFWKTIPEEIKKKMYNWVSSPFSFQETFSRLNIYLEPLKKFYPDADEKYIHNIILYQETSTSHLEYITNKENNSEIKTLFEKINSNISSDLWDNEIQPQLEKLYQKIPHFLVVRLYYMYCKKSLKERIENIKSGVISSLEIYKYKERKKEKLLELSKQNIQETKLRLPFFKSLYNLYSYYHPDLNEEKFFDLIINKLPFDDLDKIFKSADEIILTLKDVYNPNNSIWLWEFYIKDRFVKIKNEIGIDTLTKLYRIFFYRNLGSKLNNLNNGITSNPIRGDISLNEKIGNDDREIQESIPSKEKPIEEQLIDAERFQFAQNLLQILEAQTQTRDLAEVARGILEDGVGSYDRDQIKRLMALNPVRQMAFNLGFSRSPISGD